MRELPGFYWDEEKNRYFKLPPGGRPPGSAAGSSARPSGNAARRPSNERPSSAAAPSTSQAEPRRQKKKQKKSAKSHKQGNSIDHTKQDKRPRGSSGNALVLRLKRRKAPVIDLIRGRETGLPGLPTGFAQRFHESRAAGLVLLGEIEKLESEPSVLRATSRICPLTSFVQGPEGESQAPTLLCGSALENIVMQIGLKRPEPGNDDTDGLPGHAAAVPRASALGVFLPRGPGYQERDSFITSLVPILPDEWQHSSLVASTSLGGGGFQARLSILRIGGGNQEASQPLGQNSISAHCTANFRGTIWCADVRQDGRQAALGTNTGTVLYDINQGLSVGATFATKRSDVLSQVYSPWDMKCILRGQRNGWLNLIDTRCKDRRTMGEIKMRAPSSVTSLRFMKEAQHYALAASLDGHIGQWDLRTGREVLSFAEHRNSHKPYGIDVSQDGNLMAATGDDNRVRIWSLRNRGCSGRRLLRDLGLKPWLQANGCAFSPEAWSPRWAWAPSLWCATDRGLAAISYASAASQQQ